MGNRLHRGFRILEPTLSLFAQTVTWNPEYSPCSIALLMDISVLFMLSSDPKFNPEGLKQYPCGAIPLVLPAHPGPVCHDEKAYARSSTLGQPNTHPMTGTSPTQDERQAQEGCRHMRGRFVQAYCRMCAGDLMSIGMMSDQSLSCAFINVLIGHHQSLFIARMYLAMQLASAEMHRWHEVDCLRMDSLLDKSPCRQYIERKLSSPQSPTTFGGPL